MADWKNVSEDAKSVIKMLLKMNPQERYTAEQALSHEWVKNKAPRAKQVNLSIGLVDNLRSFRSQSQLKKAAMHIIADQLDDDRIKAQRETFKTLDTNGDGLLSASEMEAGLATAGFMEVPADLSQIMVDVDSDGSGVNCSRFLAATLDRKQYMPEKVVWDAFQFFDENGDGKISLTELTDIVGNVGGATSISAVGKIMKEVDRDGNGEIDFQEFMTAVYS